MCARFGVQLSQAQLELTFGIAPEEDELLDQPEVRPTDMSIILASDAESQRWRKVRWGLVPSWAKDDRSAANLINARSETAAEKPSFREAMSKRRCVVPASFYVEWRDEAADVQLNLFGEPTAISKPKKVKYAFFRADAEVTILAGLWERWAAPEGPLETFTILTCAPNELAGEFHDRMPCLLSNEDAETWLRTSTTVEEAQALLRPFDSAQMATRLIAD